MPHYPIVCYAKDCSHPATFKIAAHWSDGITNEMKTYALACEVCLGKLFVAALLKRAACRLAPGETLDEPGIYDLHRGERDSTLKRRPELEVKQSG